MGDQERERKNIDDGYCAIRPLSLLLLFFLLTRLCVWISGLHEVFVGSWDAFTTSRSITNDATTTNTFTNIEPKHHLKTNEAIQGKLLEWEEKGNQEWLSEKVHTLTVNWRQALVDADLTICWIPCWTWPNSLGIGGRNSTRAKYQKRDNFDCP